MDSHSDDELIQSPVAALPRRPAVRAEHIPVSLHRYAQPSGPWIWSSHAHSDGIDLGDLDTADEEEDTPVVPPAPDAWRRYPQVLYRNWSPQALLRSGLQTWINRKASDETAVYTLDVLRSGRFIPLPKLKGRQLDESLLWDFLNEPRTESLALRCFFVADLTGSIMQQLGTKFHVEPFFFSSSFNGISSRYQESGVEPESDHLTVVLPFLRTINSSDFEHSSDKKDDSAYQLVMDLQSPLSLHSGRTLLLDQVSIHLVRHAAGATLISLHPDSDFWLTTSAKSMFKRVQLAGKGVYWGRLWKNTEDSTFMMLILLWHAMYAWDESMDALFDSILYEEKRAMDQNDVGELEVTHELHNIRSALLLYDGLLKDFEHSVKFIRDRPNPALVRASGSAAAAEKSNTLLRQECDNILTEIHRLQDTKEMCRERVANAFDLIFRTLTLRDTAAGQMRSWVTQQLSYLATVFLPPTFIATVFGMNIRKLSDGALGEVSVFLATVLPLTVVTIWLMFALQRHLQEPDRAFYHHLLWPFTSVRQAVRSFWNPVNTPLKRRVRSAREALHAGSTEGRRVRGWSRVQQNLPNVVVRDHAPRSDARSTTPLAEVVRAVRGRSGEKVNGSAV